MDARQRKAYMNIQNAANDYIGGLENMLEDCEGEEYEAVKEALEDKEGLVGVIYHEATTSIYGPGFVQFSKDAETRLKDIRFCGKEWLMNCVKEVLEKMDF